ncbi:hypothetical protein RHGRI_007563 [Rhododendron griersonianum]|uniref:Uncharacterized protein n=1 Tax=Rhododendron griersonianum TaxID=479676 RepID=A0AAV6KXC3_9ERIC|nr:hypothetical protein RHGRI_007563 [Rhododendron griersonianum]
MTMNSTFYLPILFENPIPLAAASLLYPIPNRQTPSPLSLSLNPQLLPPPPSILNRLIDIEAVVEHSQRWPPLDPHPEPPSSSSAATSASTSSRRPTASSPRSVTTTTIYRAPLRSVLIIAVRGRTRDGEKTREREREREREKTIK